MTSPDWEAWRDRPRHPPDTVRFVEVTNENEAAVSGLTTHKTQEAFVAPCCGRLPMPCSPRWSTGRRSCRGCGRWWPTT